MDIKYDALVEFTYYKLTLHPQLSKRVDSGGEASGKSLVIHSHEDLSSSVKNTCSSPV